MLNTYEIPIVIDVRPAIGDSIGPKQFTTIRLYNGEL